MDERVDTCAGALAVGPEGAARELGVSRATVYELMSSGRLRSLKLGARRVIPRSAIDELLAEATAEHADGCA